MSDASVQLDEIAKRFGRVREMSLADKQKMMFQIGREVKYNLLASNMTGFRNPTHVRDMQSVYIGSGLGYAAVRAADTSTGANSPGAITNYLENGTLGGTRIRPYKFYERTRTMLIPTVKRQVEDFASGIAGKLRGE